MNTAKAHVPPAIHGLDFAVGTDGLRVKQLHLLHLRKPLPTIEKFDDFGPPK